MRSGGKVNENRTNRIGNTSREEKRGGF